MASIEKSVLVRHSAESMYALVADIESYPAFLPWCGGSRIVSTDGNVVTAEVVIDFHGLRQRFTTANAQHPPERIDLRLVDGPFSQLDGDWRFTPLAADASKVQLTLNYDFDNFLLKKLVGPVFHQIATTMVESFVKRADDVASRAAT